MSPARHRPARRTVRRSKVVEAALGIALMGLAAVGLALSSPGEDNFEVRAAPLGQIVDFDNGLLRVDHLRMGTALRQVGDSGSEPALQTTGVFVVVQVTVSAPGQAEVGLNHGQLLSRGPTYLQTTGSRTVLTQAGFASSVDLVFEVDPTQMQDLTLESWFASSVVGYHQRCRTPLGITAANAEQWAASARGRTVEASTAYTDEALS